MKVTIEQFRKKVEHLDKSWLFLKHIDDLTDKERKALIQHGISDFDDIVVVHFRDESDWFLLTLSGIYIFQEEVLRFIRYDKIADARIIMDFQQKNPKLAADTLKLILRDDNQLYLKCLDVAAVYTLDRAVTFGISFVAKQW